MFESLRRMLSGHQPVHHFVWWNWEKGCHSCLVKINHVIGNTEQLETWLWFTNSELSKFHTYSAPQGAAAFTKEEQLKPKNIDVICYRYWHKAWSWNYSPGRYDQHLPYDAQCFNVVCSWCLLYCKLWKKSAVSYNAMRKLRSVAMMDDCWVAVCVGQ